MRSVLLCPIAACLAAGCGSSETLDGEPDSAADTPWEPDLGVDSVETDPGVDDHSVPVCGDSVIEGDEECDDGNGTEWDGCNACRIVEFRANVAWEGSQYGPDVAVTSGGDTVVAWVNETGMPDIEAGIFRADGTASGDILVAEDCVDAAVTASAGGGFVVAYKH